MRSSSNARVLGFGFQGSGFGFWRGVQREGRTLRPMRFSTIEMRKFIDDKTSMITDEDPLRGFLFY